MKLKSKKGWEEQGQPRKQEAEEMHGKRRACACRLTVHSKRQCLHGVQKKTVTLVEQKPEDLSSIPGIHMVERE